MNKKHLNYIMNNSNNVNNAKLMKLIEKFEYDYSLNIFRVYPMIDYDFVIDVNLKQNLYTLFFKKDSISIFRKSNSGFEPASKYELAADLDEIKDSNLYEDILKIFDFLFFDRRYYGITRNKLIALIAFEEKRCNKICKSNSSKENKKNNSNINAIDLNGNKSIIKNEIPIYTYIVKDTRSNIYKIGQTSRLKQRISSLSTSNIYLEFIGYTNGDFELEIHNLFEDYRIISTREWFNLSESQINEIFDKYKFVPKLID